jgi:hypothetical protein
MRQVSKTTMRLLGSAVVAASAAMMVAGCGGGGGGGGGGSASTAAGISSASATQLVALEIAPPGDLVIDEGMGNAFQVIVDGHYRDGGQVDLTRTVNLQVADENVARVGGDGLITPVAVGTTELTVTTRAFTGETLTVRKRITVVPPSGAPNFAGGRLAIYPQFRTLANVNVAAGRDQLQQIVIVGTDASGRMWDLTRVNGVQIQDRNRNASMAGQLSPTGLFRGVIDGQEVLLISRLDQAALSAGAHFVLGGGSARPLPPSALYSGAPLAGSTNALDVALLSVLRGQFIEPSGLANDQEFLRRLYADALGRVPTAQEQAAFETSTAPNKRDAEIDRLVATPEFANQWGKLIGEWFEIRSANAAAFDTWVASQITAGQTVAQIVGALAAGTAGAASGTFDATHPRASDKVDILVLTGTGMTAECAVCHDHPLVGPNDTPRWTQAERYPLDAFFAANNAEATPLDKNNNRIGNPFQPSFVAFGANIPVTSTLGTPMAARRAEFARLLTATPQFDRGFAHRVFAELVLPLLDPNQFLKKNLDSVAAPALLDALAARFRGVNTDLRAFVAEVMKSKTYQLTSAGNTIANDTLAARHALRRHHSEVMESIVQNVTGMPLAGGDLNFFRQTFGFPTARASIAERSNAVNMSQSLVLMNSPIVQAKVSGATATPATLAAQVAANTITQDQAITQLFRRALARDPSADELGFARQAVAAAPTVRAGLEDVAAVVMSTIEAVSK